MIEEEDELTTGNWSQAEIDLIVADYFDMLALENAGMPFVKSHRNTALRKFVKRPAGSIERKHQNISAVLSRLGGRWIKGYKPLKNFQQALLVSVEAYLKEHGDLALMAPDVDSRGPVGMLTLVAPPDPKGSLANEPDTLRRMVRKFDPAARDARNRALGRRGEESVLNFERERLAKLGLLDLARKVRWVSQEDGDGAGYDIRSYGADGTERFLEVKTTNGSERTPFFLSENERLFSIEEPTSFRIVRLYDFFVAPKAFRLRPPLEAVASLKPAAYKVSLR